MNVYEWNMQQWNVYATDAQNLLLHVSA